MATKAKVVRGLEIRCDYCSQAIGGQYKSDVLNHDFCDEVCNELFREENEVPEQFDLKAVRYEAEIDSSAQQQKRGGKSTERRLE
jgi:hypothetical protein